MKFWQNASKIVQRRASKMSNHYIPADLKARFTWRPDNWIESYHILPAHGPVRGDCDDFAMTVGYELSGRSFIKFLWFMITFQHVYWIVRDPTGGPHMCIWARGYGWSDNWHSQWNQAVTPHKKRYPMPWPIVLVKLGMGLVL